MSTRKSLWNSGLSLANTATTVICAFITYRIVAQTAGMAVFGLWALTGAALFPLRFADLSINSAVLRYLGVAQGSGLRRVIRRVVAAALATNLLAFALFLGVALLVTPAVIHRTVPPTEWSAAFALLPYLIAASVAQLVAGVFSNAVLGLHRYRIVYLTGIVQALLQVALVLPLVSRLGIAGYALLQALMWSLLGITCALVLAFHREDHGSAPVAEFELRRFMSFAFKLNANAMLGTMVEPLAKLLLGRFGSLTTVGTYEVVLRIYNQMRLLTFAPMQPFAIAMIREREVDPAAFVRTYQMSLLYSLGVAAMFLLSIVPGWLLLRVALSLTDPLLPLVVLTTGLSTALAFAGIPAYNASIAASDVRPIMASTVIYLAGTGLIGAALGLAGGSAGVLLAVIIGNVLTNAVQVVLAGRLLGFAAVPPWPVLAGHLAAGWALVGSMPRTLRGMRRAPPVPDGGAS